MNTLSIQQLSVLQDDTLLPFDVECGAGLGTIRFEKILRLIPGRRLVASASYQGQTVVVKLFLPGHHAKRQYQHEINGLSGLEASQVNCPKVIASGALFVSAGYIVIMQAIDDAQILQQVWEQADQENQLKWLNKLFQTFITLQQNGLFHNDCHLSNFLIKGSELYVIDGGSLQQKSSPLPHAVCLKMWALLLAQFTTTERKFCYEVLSHQASYLDEKSMKRIQTLECKIRRQRQMKYLRKCLRSCTDIRVIQQAQQKLYLKRAAATEAMLTVLKQPDELFAGKLLKNGNSSTVAEFHCDGNRYVIKRNNRKSWLRWFKHQFRPSRAKRCWVNAHRLQWAEIPCAKPIGFIEKRFGPFCLRSYYITEFVAGRMISEFKQAEITPALAAKLRALFHRLANQSIIHGDLKASNVLVQNGSPLLIDLDHMRQIKTSHRASYLNEKDQTRFLANWSDPAYRQFWQQTICSER